MLKDFCFKWLYSRQAIINVLVTIVCAPFILLFVEFPYFVFSKLHDFVVDNYQFKITINSKWFAEEHRRNVAKLFPNNQ